MKKMICLLLVGTAFIATALYGSQETSKTNKEKQTSITGHWHSVEVDASMFYFIRDIHVELMANSHFFGTVTFKEGSTASRKGTYRVDGDKILFTLSGSTKPIPIKFWIDKKMIAIHEYSFDVSAHFARTKGKN